MRALNFNLSGNMACFRKPEINASTYLTYSCIHKVALLGILGSIIGLDGYNQIKKKKGEIVLPEFYNELKDLKISIVAPKKNIVQQVMSFNNSTGIASQEDGGNLIVKETILANPSWDIYILDDGNEYFEKICEYILNERSHFIPYLGRNDYMAFINDFEIVQLSDIIEDVVVYDSLIEANLNDCIPNKDSFFDFLTIEALPIGLNKKTGHYVYSTFLNCTEKFKKKENSYYYDDLVLYFY